MFDNVLFPIIIAAAVVVLFAVAVISHTKRTQKAHYDERQLLARNAACRTSFFFLLFYCLVCGFLKLFNVIWSDIAVEMFLGVVLSLALFAFLIYTIWCPESATEKPFGKMDKSRSSFCMLFLPFVFLPWESFRSLKSFSKNAELRSK